MITGIKILGAVVLFSFALLYLYFLIGEMKYKQFRKQLRVGHMVKLYHLDRYVIVEVRLILHDQGRVLVGSEDFGMSYFVDIDRLEPIGGIDYGQPG